jgi:hypothetical protein
MIDEQGCGGFRIPDRFDKREILLLQYALIIAQDVSVDRKLRFELAELENKLFGNDESFINEIKEIIK